MHADHGACRKHHHGLPHQGIDHIACPLERRNARADIVNGNIAQPMILHIALEHVDHLGKRFLLGSHLGKCCSFSILHRKDR